MHHSGLRAGLAKGGLWYGGRLFATEGRLDCFTTHLFPCDAGRSDEACTKPPARRTDKAQGSAERTPMLCQPRTQQRNSAHEETAGWTSTVGVETTPCPGARFPREERLMGHRNPARLVPTALGAPR